MTEKPEARGIRRWGGSREGRQQGKVEMDTKNNISFITSPSLGCGIGREGRGVERIHSALDFIKEVGQSSVL